MEGTRVGPYRLESQIGAGGMGVVYRAWDERLERRIAIKRIRRDNDEDSRSRQRFRREARAAARLNHPAVVQIFDVIEDAAGDWIVMEYVDGRSLARMARSGPLEPERLLKLACEIAGGLNEAHCKGVVHRDLKSQNVLVTPADHAKILDFGLAKPIWRDGAETVTRDGTLVGTYHAMSPEQVTGRGVDPRSDLFSFGSLLYEAATGTVPFRAKSPAETLKRVCLHQPRPAAELNGAVPEELSELIDRLLEKNPSHRPQSASEVVSWLEAIHDSRTPGRTHVPRPELAADSTAVVAAEVTVESDTPAAGGRPVLRTLLMTRLVGGTTRAERLGDARASEVAGRHDRLARDLLQRFDGFEIDRTDRFLCLFDRPIDAVRYALSYHQALAELERELEVELRAGAVIHVGEVALRENPAADVARGAKPLEVDGVAKTAVARVLPLAAGRQTLMTWAAFDLARHAALGEDLAEANLRWLAHGGYLFEGVEEPVELFEVGVVGVAPLAAPADSETARRAVSASDELTLGWRAGARQRIPHRSHWVLYEQLGEGGFGEVWLAEHEATGEKRVFKFCYEADRLRSLQREVTLFRLLKEALGQRHDIARVLDWNFDEAPYFLESEYTEGGDLVEWAKAQGGLPRVPLATRLELVAQAAEALAAAHSVGVLHKDVKPRNILVTTDPRGRPRVRLTDFGIGRITDRSLLAERGIPQLGLTETRPQAGTQLYRAPELTEGKAATIQADVYALGVLLYQVVVGDFTRALAPGWRRHVDNELLAEDLAGFVDGTPERRPGSALEVAERLRSLERRRERREAERRERREAEAARRALERSHRRRRLFAALAAAATAVAVVVTILAVRTAQAHRKLERRTEQADQLIGFMLGDLRRKLLPIGQLDTLDDAAQEALAYFAALEEDEVTEESLSRNVEALMQIGMVRVRQGELPAAQAVFGEALRLADALAARDPSHGERQEALGRVRSWLGFVSWQQGELDAALAQFRSALSLTQDLVTREPDHENGWLRLAQAHTNIGKVLEARGSLDAALREYRETLTICERQNARLPDSSKWRLELAWAHTNVGKVEVLQGHLDSALDHYRADLAAKRELARDDPDNKVRQRDLANSHVLVAEVQEAQGDWAPALEHARTAVAIMEGLVEQNPTDAEWQFHLATYRNAVGRGLRAQGDRQGALRSFAGAASILEGLLAKSTTNAAWQRELATSEAEQGVVYLFLGRHREALAVAARARDRLVPLVERDSRDRRSCLWLGKTHILLARAWDAAGETDRAEDSRRRALELFEPFAASSDLEVAAARAAVLRDVGATTEAADILQRLQRSGYRKREDLYGPPSAE